MIYIHIEEYNPFINTYREREEESGREIQTFLKSKAHLSFFAFFPRAKNAQVCKLVNAFLRRRSNTDAIVPHMPEEGARLATIRVMENMEFFRDGCRRLGLSDGDLCNTFDLVEGKGGIETVRCLEAIVHFGRSIPQSE